MRQSSRWILAGLLVTSGTTSGVVDAQEAVPSKVTALPATYVFPAGATTEIAVSSSADVMVAWKATYDSDKACQDFCIEAKDQYGDGTVSTDYGSIKATSRNGQISVIMTNVEQFRMEVSIKLE